MEITSKEQYQILKEKVEANNEARLAYCKANKTNGIPCEIAETFPFANEINNDVRSAIEVYEFVCDPPKNYFLYVNEKTRKATTWTGQDLGNIVFGNSWKSNLGDLRMNVTVHAINGQVYAGTYYKGAGSYARIKLLKNQKWVKPFHPAYV